jgi:murein DD-endopeptidase MepM/ murein hydrolase activator NlpD
MQLFWRFVLFLSLGLLLHAQAPRAYHELGSAYERDLQVISQLQYHPYFKPYEAVLTRYTSAVDTAFQTGRLLDEVIDAKSDEAALLRKQYLKELRVIRKDQQAVEKVYAQALGYAIQNDDLPLFELLLEHAMEPLKSRHLKKRVQHYYEKKRKSKKIRVAEALMEQMSFEAESRKIAMQEMQAYEEALQVLAEEEAARLRKTTAEKRLRNVIVSTKKTDQGYRFLADNLNAYTVTVTLNFKELNNFGASVSLPLRLELSGNSSREILELVRVDTSRPASFSSTFSWVRGSVSARHDDSVIYHLPFAPGSRVYVSQGYNGASTHRGMSRYAVDFPVPVGTPVYAARGGTVVACEERYNKGGYAKSFGKYANYVVIEHTDKTLGNYYHLKQNGVTVSVGDHVKVGTLLGYSGNTGYSSGPHLHFSVSKVDPQSGKRPMTIPVRFKNSSEVVSNPKRGDWYGVDL